MTAADTAARSARAPAVLAPGLRSRAAGLRDRADPAVRHGVRRLLVLLCLSPLLLVLAGATLRLTEPSLTLIYGCVVLAGTIAVFHIAYTRYRDPSESAVPVPRRLRDAGFPPLPPAPSVTFLLAVRDEADGIEACVRSMVSSDCQDVRVTVVDDHSGDGTGDVLRRLRDELGITVIHLDENVGKKHALVTACAGADTDIVAFTDSDCVLAPDALGRCVQALVRNPALGAVSGHCRALNASANLLTRVQDTWYEGQFRVAKAAEASFGSVSCVSGPLAVFRRDAVYNYLPAWADDRFMGAPFKFATDRQLTGYVLGQVWKGRSLKARYADSPFLTDEDFPERPWQVGYVRSAKVWTDVPARLGPLLRQQVRWKKSFIRNLFFTGGFMWRRGAGPAALFYGHVLWVLAAPVLACTHLLWAPAHGTLLLTGLYLLGVLLKGCAWAVAYRIDHPGDPRWRYRPLMSVFSAVVLAWLLPYSLLTVRKGVWSRGTS
ncbi:glycosyltransferase [uncultured Streptomyces sp.]|uniref:glycosyltransferase family 2 protein n=1 Tax=uncultured Streptomyces sp. TaxID=174707 RepID=UPI00261420B3|nr:glycosyltransferase [uncultured Streptomyces sp.]